MARHHVRVCGTELPVVCSCLLPLTGAPGCDGAVSRLCAAVIVTGCFYTHVSVHRHSPSRASCLAANDSCLPGQANDTSCTSDTRRRATRSGRLNAALGRETQATAMDAVQCRGGCLQVAAAGTRSLPQPAAASGSRCTVGGCGSLQVAAQVTPHCVPQPQLQPLTSYTSGRLCGYIVCSCEPNQWFARASGASSPRARAYRPARRPAAGLCATAALRTPPAATRARSCCVSASTELCGTACTCRRVVHGSCVRM